MLDIFLALKVKIFMEKLMEKSQLYQVNRLCIEELIFHQALDIHQLYMMNLKIIIIKELLI